MTFVAPHIRMASLQGEMGPRVVVEDRGNPALRSVTIRTSRLSDFHKLACVRIFVTILTNLRRTLELYLLRRHRHFVTIAAFDSPVRAEEREFGFGMVEAVDVCPGPHMVASFAAQRRAVGAALRHAVLELVVMRILVAGCTASVFEMEGQNLIRSARRAYLMTIGARHGSMSTR